MMVPFYQNKLVPRLAKIVTFLVIFWIIFLLGRSLWQNWQLKRSISELNEQIVALNQQKKDLENLNLYYNSSSFKELEARRQLGLKKPDEKMVVLPNTSPSPSTSPGNFTEELKKEKESIAGISAPAKIPNWLLWWQYFTK